jgi:hypothetical protein
MPVAIKARSAGRARPVALQAIGESTATTVAPRSTHQAATDCGSADESLLIVCSRSPTAWKPFRVLPTSMPATMRGVPSGSLLC